MLAAPASDRCLTRLSGRLKGSYPHRTNRGVTSRPWCVSHSHHGHFRHRWGPMTARRVPRGQVIGSGVDYITVTASAGVRERRLQRFGENLIRTAVDAGNECRERTALGYDWVECGGIGLGNRAGGSILRISGAGASSACTEALRNADNVSRIDLQTTVRFSRDVSALGRVHAAELQRLQRQRKRRLTARLERTYGAGDTLYVGSRNSNYFGRIYDKFRESGDLEYRKCWRYEVECKGDGATKAAEVVEASSNSPQAIAAGVSDWYRNRGIMPG